MRLLVFGSTGQVARELKRRAPDAIFLSRGEADLMDPTACAAAVAASGAEVVINAAAWTAVDKAEAEEAAATVVNADAPGAMARAAAARDVPFIQVSTDYVFDGSGTKPWHPDDPTGPLGAYGRSKLAGEHEIRAAGGNFAILRTSWVFSSHGANFVKTMLRLAQDREIVSVVSDQVGGPTAASDIAAALLDMAKLLHRRDGAPGTYHFSGAPDVSWADFAREIFRQSHKKVRVLDIPTEAYPTPAKRPHNSRLDCRTTELMFGIARPDWRTSLHQVLKEVGEI